MLHIYVTLQLYGQIIYKHRGTVAKGKEDFYRSYYKDQKVRFEEKFIGDKIIEKIEGQTA